MRLMTRPARPLDALDGADGPKRVATRADERDPPVVAAETPPPDPGHLAERAELVEEPRLVAGDAGREHVTLQHRRRDRQAGQLVDDLGEALQGGRATERGRGTPQRRDAVPVGQEAAERGRIDRLDLAPQARQRATTEQPQDVGVAPLAFRAARPELAAEQRARGQQPFQGVLDDARPAAPSAAPGRASGTARAIGPSERGARRGRH